MCIFKDLKVITKCDSSPFCKFEEDTQSIEPYYDEIDEDCNIKTDENSNSTQIVDFLNKELEYEIYYDNEVRFCQRNTSFKKSRST